MSRRFANIGVSSTYIETGATATPANGAPLACGVTLRPRRTIELLCEFPRGPISAYTTPGMMRIRLARSVAPAFSIASPDTAVMLYGTSCILCSRRVAVTTISSNCCASAMTGSTVLALSAAATATATHFRLFGKSKSAWLVSSYVIYSPDNCSQDTTSLDCASIACHQTAIPYWNQDIHIAIIRCNNQGDLRNDGTLGLSWAIQCPWLAGSNPEMRRRGDRPAPQI